MNTGVGSPEELATQLLAAEDTKFRMFAFVSERNVEVELLEAQIAGLQTELQQATSETQQRRQQQQQQTKVNLHKGGGNPGPL